ncbi:MAG: lysylphosphatidylglycerol synthase transmembrane domain-containing protein, partial [Pseudomonadota bacterium]
RLAFALGLVALCFSQVEVGEVARALGRVAPGELMIAFAAITLGTVVIPAVITRRALAVDRLSFTLRELVAINLAMRFYIIVLPRVVAIGLRWARYGRGRLGREALALLVFERAVYMSAMFLLASLALLAEVGRLGPAGGAVLALSAGLFLAFSAVLLPFLHGPSAALAGRVAGWMERRAPRFVARRAAGLVQSITAYRSLRAEGSAVIFLYSLAAVLLFVVSAWFVARALGLEIGILALVWVRALVFAFTLIPFSVGGIGLREVGFIGLLGLYGIGAADALAFSLANFGLQLAIAALGVVVELRGAVARARVRAAEGASEPE